MKKAGTIVVFMATTLLIMAQTEPDFDASAESIVNHSREVQPGEVVILSGTPAELDLLSAMVVAVAKAGGLPSVEISIPEANKRAIMETPIEFLGQVSSYYVMQSRVADCFFNAGSTQDPGLFADVPEERRAAMRKANIPTQKLVRNSKARSVGLGQTGGIPTPAYAEQKGADFEEMLDMFWKSLNTDYMKMTATANKLKRQLKPGSMVQLSSDAGTDLQLRLADKAAKINCGRCLENADPFGPAMAFLPAGEVYTPVDPESASGTLVIPSTDFRGRKFKNVVLEFNEGRIVDIQADQDVDPVWELLQNSMEASRMISSIDLGINPDSHPLSGSDFYSWEMAGMVTLMTGGNTWAGGEIVSDAALVFHVADCDLSIAGTPLIEKGELKAGQLALQK